MSQNLKGLRDLDPFGANLLDMAHMCTKLEDSAIQERYEEKLKT